MASQVMRIILKAYDHEMVDASAKKIIETVKKNGSQVSGPVPLPTKKEVVPAKNPSHLRPADCLKQEENICAECTMQKPSFWSRQSSSRCTVSATPR